MQVAKGKNQCRGGQQKETFQNAGASKRYSSSGRKEWLWQVWVAAERDLGCPFLRYFKWIC